MTQDGHGYITATKEGVPVLGLVAHMGTSSARSGCSIRPQVVYYQGGDILLNQAEHIINLKNNRMGALSRECI